MCLQELPHGGQYIVLPRLLHILSGMVDTQHGGPFALSTFRGDAGGTVSLQTDIEEAYAHLQLPADGSILDFQEDVAADGTAVVAAGNGHAVYGHFVGKGRHPVGKRWGILCRKRKDAQNHKEKQCETSHGRVRSM